MQQGYSGSTVRRDGDLVIKASSDTEFTGSPARQADLLALSRRLVILPRIAWIRGEEIAMEFIAGQEGLARSNARQTGRALRLLHDQTGYPHPCVTGMDWLIDLANRNLELLGSSLRLPAALAQEYPPDALILSEPNQLIERADGSVVFIDFESLGMGSRYHDLGYLRYITGKFGQPEVYALLLQTYQEAGEIVDPRRALQAGGIAALAYSGFGLQYEGLAEAQKRLQIGLDLLEEAGLG